MTSEDIRYAIQTAFVTGALAFIAFTVSQCNINHDTMIAKYPHSYSAETKVNGTTGPQQ
jgi:hypothetical protein